MTEALPREASNLSAFLFKALLSFHDNFVLNIGMFDLAVNNLCFVVVLSLFQPGSRTSSQRVQ